MIIGDHNLIYLLFYFSLYSVGGWVIESIYRSFCEKKIVLTGFLHGPYCPIYGFGTMIIILFLSPLKEYPVLLFLSGVIILTLWEYVIGIYLEKIFHKKYWDYSHTRFNINGRICLVNSIYWGVLSVAFLEVIHPYVRNIEKILSLEIVFWLDILIYILVGLDLTITLIKLHTLKENIVKIKENLKKLKSKKNEDRDELELDTQKLQYKVYKTLEKIKVSFSGINSTPINKFFEKNKVDLKEMKEKIKKLNNKILKKKEKQEKKSGGK